MNSQAPSHPATRRVVAVFFLILPFSVSARADDAAGAIGAFDKSCPGYDTLSGYFATLTSSFEITNEADVLDEKTSSDTVTVTLDWTLTLQSVSSAATSRKEQQVTVDVARKTSKIVRFSPIELFRPA